MRTITSFVITLVLLAGTAPAGPSILERLSLSLHGGRSWATPGPVEWPKPSSGPSFDAGLAGAVVPGVRLTADIGLDRLGVSEAIMSARLTGTEPFSLITALAGIDVRVPFAPGSRGGFHVGLAGGAGWMHEGILQGVEMDGPSFTDGGGRSSHPVVAAQVGALIPTALAHADVDLGWREFWVERTDGELRVTAMRAGLVLHP